MMRIGLPSKGRLMEQAADWLAARGIVLRTAPDGRGYGATLEGLAGAAPVMMAAGEIPRDLAAGRIHLGITGTDLIREKLDDWRARVAEVAALGFGRADLVIAVPAAWIDVETLDDLDAAAAAFRAAHGHRLRIATKYHRLVREHLAAAGVADYALVDSQGATEGTVAQGSAEAVADITSTGSTLRANHLKMLADGPILRSEAVLWAARGAAWGAAERAALADLCARIGAAVPLA